MKFGWAAMLMHQLESDPRSAAHFVTIFGLLFSKLCAQYVKYGIDRTDHRLKQVLQDSIAICFIAKY